jgi:hypothetical protein
MNGSWMNGSCTRRLASRLALAALGLCSLNTPLAAHTLTTHALSLLTGALLTGAPAPGDLPGVGQLGGPQTALSDEDMARFLAGRAQFDRNFHIADGVGTPEMNADSCRACHQDPLLGGAGGLELNVTRFGSDNGGAGPFQDLPGGQGLSKLRPPLVPGRESYPPEADVFEQRQTPSLFGLGLLDSVPDAVILANEDPGDGNGDGIFGVAHLKTIGGLQEVGRFGWKAQVPRLADFVRDAMGGENGITTPDDGRGFALVSDADAVADPEFSEQQVGDMAFFLEQLAAPQRVGSVSLQVTRGEEVFSEITCDRCHIPTLQGSGGPVTAYTNLLVHDVMAPGYRGMSEPGAPTGFFRTPPLWGIRLSAPYMHDGRAETLRDAIQAHDGEGLGASSAYALVSASDQEALIAFLEDL